MEQFILWKVVPLDLALDFHEFKLRKDLDGKYLLIIFINFIRKKMNFTTDLPKKNPLVTYIVASAVKC